MYQTITLKDIYINNYYEIIKSILTLSLITLMLIFVLSILYLIIIIIINV